MALDCHSWVEISPKCLQLLGCFHIWYTHCLFLFLLSKTRVQRCYKLIFHYSRHLTLFMEEGWFSKPFFSGCACVYVMCEHVFVCMHVWVHGYLCIMCTRIWKLEENLGCLSSNSIQLVFICLLLWQGFLWTWSSLSKLSCLGSEPWDLSGFTSPVLGSQVQAIMHSFLSWVLESNLDPHAWAANTLLTKPLAQPSPNLLKQTLSQSRTKSQYPVSHKHLCFLFGPRL